MYLVEREGYILVLSTKFQQIILDTHMIWHPDLLLDTRKSIGQSYWKSRKQIWIFEGKAYIHWFQNIQVVYSNSAGK